MKNKKSITLLLSIVIILNYCFVAFADTVEMPQIPETVADAYVLTDLDTGRVLIDKNPNEKYYPASLTKLLTALIAVEYIDEGDLIVIGTEINSVPWDSSLAGHKVGETILFENLMRGLLLPSGNDSATVLAMEVARRISGDENISLDDGIALFTKTMNEKAKSLGATNSNFVTPHGYHDPNHYTTANDMTLITMSALQNKLIKEICAEKMFEGNSAGDKRTVDMQTQDYVWDNTNLLLGGRLAKSDYIYKNATGVKTGSTSEAGYCLVSTATNTDDENLLFIAMKSTSNDIWSDSKKLLDYGFDNYSKVVLQERASDVKEVLIDNPKLGTDNVLSVVTSEEVSLLLNESEKTKITATIDIDDTKKTDSKSSTQDTTLLAPIKRGEVLGTLSYSLDGNVLYNGNIVAQNDVLKRTISSDLKYYAEITKNVLFSWLIIPITAAVVLTTVFSIRLYNIAKIKRKKRRSAKKYRFKTKY